MGQLIRICVAEVAEGQVRSVEEIECVPGRGLVGDRYHRHAGTFSPPGPSPSHEITLVEVEEVERFNAAHGADLKLEDLRRNLVTRGIALNELVGRRFSVGPVVLEGIRLCEPCAHLARLTRADVLEGLVHRGGLRAAVIRGGTIRVGDSVREGQEGAA